MHLNKLAQQKAHYRAYISYVATGKAFPKQATASVSSVVKPGVTIKASDRDYTVTERGYYLRRNIPSESHELSRSQIYIPARPRKNDKYGNLRLTA